METNLGSNPGIEISNGRAILIAVAANRLQPILGPRRSRAGLNLPLAANRLQPILGPPARTGPAPHAPPRSCHPQVCRGCKSLSQPISRPPDPTFRPGFRPGHIRTRHQKYTAPEKNIPPRKKIYRTTKKYTAVVGQNQKYTAHHPLPSSFYSNIPQKLPIGYTLT